MANHKSALKRASQNEVRRLRNRAVRTRVKNAIKEVRAAKAEKSDESVNESLIKAQSTINRAAKKGGLHKRTAARKISRLAKLANSTQS